MYNEEGFTLLEVLIAMVIMGISFSILVHGFIQVNAGIESNQNYTYVSSWAVAKINELASGIELNNHGQFKYQEEIYDWSVEEYYLDDNIKKMVLKIEWEENTRMKHYSLTRLVIRN